MSKYFKTSRLSLSQTLVNLIMIVIVIVAMYFAGNLALILIIILISLMIFYFVNNYLLEVFIGKKIDKIYKVMDTQKEILKEGEKKKTFAQVENEMDDWVKAKQSEILNLKKTENYRKEFLGNISHELKTPIFIAQSYIETLLDGSIDDNKVNRKHLKKSLKSILRLSTIVEDLEMISKLERDSDNLPKTAFDINALINEVIDSLEIKIREENVSISNEISKDNNCLVFANRDKIEQVVYNLLENAIKYKTKKDALIKIKTEESNGKCLISIIDNGIGINKEDIPRIFERFYRVDKNRSRKKGGSGLGLSIVKHIIEAHNQSITVESEVTKGSKFQFTLDLKKNDLP